MLPTFLFALFAAALAPRSGDEAPAPVCLGEPPCLSPRALWVDHAALGLGPGGEWLVYDLDEVTRPLHKRDLVAEGDLSITVRLSLGEVGADRLVASRYGLVEALGIAWTVRNRLDEATFDPEGRGSAAFPGCGPTGRFSTCANPRQYAGLGTWRALEPSRYREDIRLQAVDVAVLAWWLYDGEKIDDPTEGATNFIHRCGGTAYGADTDRCDGWMGHARADDIRGAKPTTGPLVFKAPGGWDKRGWYRLREATWVDFDPWYDVVDGHLVSQISPPLDTAALDVASRQAAHGFGPRGASELHRRLAASR